MRIETAIKFLKRTYELGLEEKRVTKPVSWALYQTWKWVDTHEKEVKKR